MLHVTLSGKKEIAKDTWQFLFHRPKEFLFTAGQYTTIFLEKENRDFTISGSEQDNTYFSIITKKGKSEFKKNLFNLSSGTVITLTLPSGGFVLHKNQTPKVFIAGGIGITPFYSMLVSNKTIKIPITLFVSFSREENVIFFDEMNKVQEGNQNIRIIYSLTQQKWDNETGRISERLIKKYVPSVNAVEYMIAGGEQMVYDMEELLLSMQVPQEKIRIDIFTGY